MKSFNYATIEVISHKKLHHHLDKIAIGSSVVGYLPFRRELCIWYESLYCPGLCLHRPINITFDMKRAVHLVGN